jgi:hypothetical protein
MMNYFTKHSPEETKEDHLLSNGWKIVVPCHPELSFVIHKPQIGAAGIKGLTFKIPGSFLPISTSKMLKFSKKSPKNKIK